jgi:biofilm PGA synthesis protein PgaA
MFILVPRQFLKHGLIITIVLFAVFNFSTANADNTNAQQSYVVASIDDQPYTSVLQNYSPLKPVPPPQQLATEDDLENKAFLQINSTYDISPSSNVNGGTNYGIDTKVYSAPFYKSWRLFAGEYYTHEIEPLGEGRIGYSQSIAGIQYDTNKVTVSIAPTYNNYNYNQRVGSAATVSWYVDPNWTLGAGNQIFSKDIPLRALNSGITANSYNANIGWSEEGKRDIRVDVDMMTFSDYDLRSTFSGSYTEHLFENPHVRIDSLVTLAESQNSLDENRPYFNPKQDYQAMVGPRITEPLYTGHGITYEHSLELTPGIYWQQNYGDSPAFSAHYQQRVTGLAGMDADVGLIYTRQSYDGAANNDMVILFDLTERF